MVVLPVAIAGMGAVTDCGYTLIVLETVILILFAVFWIIQTFDVWDARTATRA
jgi:hypothetical protein